MSNDQPGFPSGQPWPQQPGYEPWPQNPRYEQWPQNPRYEPWPQNAGYEPWPQNPAYQPWGAPPPPPPPNRSLWLVIGAVVLVVVLIVGGGALIWRVNRNSSSTTAASSTPGATLSSSSPTFSSPTFSSPLPSSSVSTAPSGSPNTRLMNLLPQGYTPNTCRPSDPLPNTLATIGCDQNTEVGGPSSGLYALYADQTKLRAGFDQTTHIKTQQLVNCPGSTDSAPGTYHKNSAPNVPAGYVACGQWNNSHTVIWTVDADLVLAIAIGDDLNAMYDWWGKYG